MKKYVLICLVLLFLCVSLSGCVPGDGAKSETNRAGLFSGIWHGWIAPFSLLVSIFKKQIGIYEVYNNGFLYNLGYYAAIISGFGGLSLVRKKRKSKSDTNKNT